MPQKTLRGKPQAIIDAVAEFNATRTWLMVFQSPKIIVSRQILEARSEKPKVIVELGGYVGCSAVAWGAMLKDFHTDLTGCKVYSCEMNPKFAKIARDLIKLAEVDDVVEVVEGKSSDSIQSLKDEGKLNRIDVLFLDHWEAFYLPDLKLCEDLGLLQKGSLLLTDNTDSPGAPEYLEYVKAGGRGAQGGMQLQTKTYDAPVPEGEPVCLASTSW